VQARHPPSAGFTLVEVLVALALLVSMALGVAQVIAASTRAVQQSRAHAAAVILAAAKMDELRSLAWTFEPAVDGVAAVHRSDRDTDVSHPDHPPGGAGLSASPDDALSVNTAGCVDYLDASGRWVGNDREPPPDAAFIRRWAVRPLAEDPERTLVLQVLVITVRDARARAGGWSQRRGSDALLVSVRTRAGR
jgi:prepilin-type N-terminal cleavage/methylation domain-containing protein